MKWYHWAAIAGALMVGFFSGRGSVPRAGTVSVSPPPAARDGGVPEARATAQVDKGGATLSYTCKVEPPKVRYVKVPNTALTECPQVECPAVSCSGTATSETPPARAETTVPLPPPSVVTLRETEPRRIWGIGPAGLGTYEGKFGYGAAGTWSPFRNLDAHLQVTTVGVGVDIQFRF